MVELEIELECIIINLEKICEKLYQEKLTDGYNDFLKVIGELSELATKIFQESENKVYLSFDYNLFISNLALAIQALENRDAVLLADILYHELSVQFKDFLEQVKYSNSI